MAEAHHQDCSICNYYARLTEEQLIWQDEEWVAAMMMDVPGWIMVATRRHSEGIWGLNEAEVARLGPALPKLTGALREATGAERIHMAAQGEHSLHFHFVLMARRPGDIPVFDGQELARRGAEVMDADASAALTRRLRGMVTEGEFAL